MADETERVRIQFDTNAGQVAGQVNNLGGALDNLTESGADATRSMHNLDASFDEVYGDIRPLTAQLGELEDRLYQLQQTGQGATEEFRALTAEAARLRQAQQAVDRQIDATSQTIGQKLGSASQIAASGISVVTSGMVLLGADSEETEKALLKVQAAMAFADSVSSLVELKEQFGVFRDLVVSGYQRIIAVRRAEIATMGQATIAQRILNATALMNPYIAIVAALTALVAVTYIWVKSNIEAARVLKSATDAVQKNKDKTDELARSIEDSREFLSDYNNLEVSRARALGATDIEIRKLIESQKELDRVNAESQRSQATKNLAEASDAYTKALISNNEDLIKDAKENFEKAREIAEESVKTAKKLRIDEQINKLNNQAEDLNSKKDAAKKLAEERKKAREDELAKYREFLAEQKRIRQEGENEVRKSIDSATEKNINSMISAQESEIRAVKDKYFQLIEAAKQYGYDTEQLEIARQNDLNDISLKYQQKELEAKQEQRDDQKERELEAWSKESDERIRLIGIRNKLEEESKDRALSNGEQLAAGMKVLAGKNKAVQRAAIIAEGGINAGKTISNTAAAVASDLKLGFPANIAPIALDVAVGAVSLASTIKGTNDALKAVGGGSAPSPSGGIQAVTAPSVQFNNTSENQIAQATASAQASAPPIKVNVLESDITVAQDNVKVLESNNSF